MVELDVVGCVANAGWYESGRRNDWTTARDNEAVY